MNDLVAIGETTIDAFIRLGAEAHVVLDKEHGRVSLPAAAKIPFEFVEEIPAVANASNAAVAAARLGLKSALMANVGSDTNGAKCIARLNV
jgi:sugar/nucleoside kinase (ribokinase family)